MYCEPESPNKTLLLFYFKSVPTICFRMTPTAKRCIKLLQILSQNSFLGFEFNFFNTQVNAFFENFLNLKKCKLMAATCHFPSLEPALRLSGLKLYQEKLRFEHPDQYPTMASANESALMLWGLVADGRHRKEQKRLKQILKIILTWEFCNWKNCWKQIFENYFNLRIL